MEIYELTTAHKMSITIANARTNISLNSNIVFVEDNKLYVEPFVYEGAVLNFDSANVTISMIAYEEEKSPYLWQVVHIAKEVRDNTPYHVISSNLSGVKINRRENFRLFLGIEGTATLMGGKPFDVLVKDISSSGFAVLVDMNKPINVHKNDIMQLEFVDATFNEDFVLNGRVVRMDKTDKYLLYGCRMVSENPVIDKYIANKQLENRVNSARKNKD
ncbi:MAG: PilZ domain-containing protein [Lachnospiraceae bacterium]|nr:PilZ domain-containing protein [Lachnospiraceae bacterium]